MKQAVRSRTIQDILEEELERLKRMLCMGYELEVIWMPDENSRLAGEVRENRIFVYEVSEEEAIETLRHEFIDYTISNIIEPYKEIANKLIMLINEEAYRRKERLVEGLRKLI